MKEHYVYALLDPRKPGSYIYDSYHFEFEPFYVGMGINDRIDSHDKDLLIKLTKFETFGLKNYLLLKLKFSLT
jgi:hypothetical protein